MAVAAACYATPAAVAAPTFELTLPMSVAAAPTAATMVISKYHHQVGNHHQQHHQVPGGRSQPPPPPQKDYCRPLHVDCSVEYELPNAAKPPPGVRNEPLLMIHPLYFRKIESQRKSAFVNNLPISSSTAVAGVTAGGGNIINNISAAAITATSTYAPVSAKRRIARGQQLPQQMPQQAAQYPVHYVNHQPQYHSHQQLPPPQSVQQHHHSHQHQWSSGGGCDSLIAAAPVSSSCCNNLGGKHLDQLSGDSGHCTDSSATDQSSQQHCSFLEKQSSSTAAANQTTSNGGSTLSGKYRQYLRAHRLHPYINTVSGMTTTASGGNHAALHLAATTFPQLHHQQVCYNV